MLDGVVMSDILNFLQVPVAVSVTLSNTISLSTGKRSIIASNTLISEPILGLMDRREHTCSMAGAFIGQHVVNRLIAVLSRASIKIFILAASSIVSSFCLRWSWDFFLRVSSLRNKLHQSI